MMLKSWSSIKEMVYRFVRSSVIFQGHRGRKNRRSDLFYVNWSHLIFVSLGLALSLNPHYNDIIMGAKASQISSLMIVCSTVYSGADQRKHESSASLAFVRGIHRGPVNSPHKCPVTRKTFPFDDVIMLERSLILTVSPFACISILSMVFFSCSYANVVE